MNPLKSNELVFFKFLDSSQTGPGIYFYDRNTRIKSKIYNGTIGNSLAWSRKNWLLFKGANAQLYKMKPNGDSLTQLTNYGNFFCAKWNYEGDKIISQRLGYNYENKLMILSENGDSIIKLDNDYRFNEFDWNSQDGSLLVSYSSDKIYKTISYDNLMSNNILQPFKQYKYDDIGALNPIWLNSNTILLTCGATDLCTYNILTDERICIRRVCSGYSSIVGFNVSNNDEIVCVKYFNLQQNPSNYFKTSANIVILSTSGALIDEITDL